jgi:hypothetical protein
VLAWCARWLDWGVNAWSLGIQAWVIQDGKYEDFVVRRRYEFQVEAFPHSVERGEVAKVPSVRPGEQGRHGFSGAVLKFVGHGAWVIDFGAYCYGKAVLPQGLRVGDALAGEVSFFVGYPAVYEEAFDAEAPLRTYSWRLERIRLETTPSIDEAGGLPRDTKVTYADLPATNGWADEPTALYLLDCTLLGRVGGHS